MVFFIHQAKHFHSLQGFILGAQFHMITWRSAALSSHFPIPIAQYLSGFSNSEA